MLSRQIKIKTLCLIGGLVAVVVTAIIALGLYTANHDHENAELRQRFAAKVVAQVFQLTSLTGEYLLYQEERAGIQWISTHKSLQTTLAEFESSTYQSGQTIVRLRNYSDTVHALFVRMLNKFQEMDNFENTLGNPDIQVKRLAARLLTITQAMVSQASVLLQQSQAVHVATSLQIRWIFLITIVLSILLLVALWLLVARRIIAPLQQLIEGIRIFGDNPNYRLRPRYKDEIGDVASAFNDVVQNLHDTQVSKNELADEVVEHKRAEEVLTIQASHDVLTGLINRREFERRLARVLESASSGREEHVLCYLDLDRFKIVNDTCGHTAGDELLRQVGWLLSETVRKRDTLARLGGDEFGVLMEHCSLEQACRVAENIRLAIADFHFGWERRAFRIGVSIGVVPIVAGYESVATLLNTADGACYAAKDEGRNRVHVYRRDDADLVLHHGAVQWVERIDTALQDGRLQLWSQPIVPILGGSSEGEHFELLLRLIDEQGNTITPGVFLPAAERYGYATRLDRWVIATAFGWLSRNPKLLERLHLCCINLSGASLTNEKFLPFVQDQLDQFRIPPHKICFEVTETAAIANLSMAVNFMGSLRARGCRFSLDDFGSGLSSFAYLKTLPVDYLKIDGELVKDIVHDQVDLALVRSINNIGKVMGKRTIAEFVESAAVLRKLGEIGVDYAQGFGVGHPGPLDETSGSNPRSVEVA